MRIVDFCCNAGGATAGYRLAFPDAEIVGIDIDPQPRYCGDTFMQADIMACLANKPFLDSFDLIHVSPPCHDHSTVTGKDRKSKGEKGTGWMLAQIGEILRAQSVPYVIENVEAATMPAGVDRFRLCGSSFGLDVRRHRRFTTSFVVLAPQCQHAWQTPRFTSLENASRKAGRLASVVGVHGSTQYPGDRQLREKAMGIDWMTLAELNQALPPAYCEFIGQQFAQSLERAA